MSALGLGAGKIGDLALDDGAAGQLLNAALDCGITLIDTARGYGASEDRIGRHLAHRRRDFVLSTKIGYGIAGHDDWTGSCITAGVDAALERLRTDFIDIVHLHSCPIEVLAHGDVVAALQRAVAAGKVRVAAYSGDNAALDWAIASGCFGSVQTSINLFDQRVLGGGLAAADSRQLGVIAKRPIANAPWRFADRPIGDYCETYWQRMRAMNIDPRELSWDELALRFTAFLPGVSSCIVGTHDIEHLRKNARLLERGALPESVVNELRAAFVRCDDNWIGQT